MSNRTWNSVTIPNSDLFVFFAYKVVGDGVYSVFTHEDISVYVNKSVTGTLIQIPEVLASLDIGIIDDVNNWVIVLLDMSGTTIKAYVNDSVIPITDTILPVLSSESSELVVGGSGLDLSNLRIGSGNINVYLYSKNYIYEDLVNNSGDLFFEVM